MSMKEPKPDRFDPTQDSKHVRPDEIDMEDMPQIKAPQAKTEPDEDSSSPPEKETTAEPQESWHENKRTSRQSSLHASMIASKHDSMIESIRRVVKETGSEVAYARLTPAEKRQLQDVVYSYKRQDTETSETEVIRIGLNALLEDYQEHGKESTLARVIAALNA